MIVVDSSAIIAVAADEPDADAFSPLMLRLECVVGWPTVLETEMVLRGRRMASALEYLDLWIARPNVVCLPFDRPHYQLAAEAFDRFGKGRHAAGLNFGDCMSYAVARANAVPLLYKGTDFAKTDVRSARP
ncbi:MAG: type II toxin-antitoxin system VapC family toxin [Bauldia sp.]|nr:type II toxin-antitoxin system VapC family toxin [Bauldia sp.]